MEKISNVTSLSEKLKAKTELDRLEIETMIKSELEKLAISLKTQSEDVLSTTLVDIQKQIDSKTEPLVKMLSEIQTEASKLNALTTKAWLRPALISVAILASISIACWGLSAYISMIIESQINQKVELSNQIAVLEATVSKLEAKTMGVTIIESKDGKFLVLPEGMTATTGWTIGKQQAD